MQENGGTPLLQQLGEIDIYLLDQMMKGRIGPGMRILDAGCGSGRNLSYMMSQGWDVTGVDSSVEAIEAARSQARRVGYCHGEGRFSVSGIERLPFGDAEFDAIICNAVLHFASDESGFQRMLEGVWRVLAPGGILFARLASIVGIEDRVRHLEGRRYALPDGSDRFLVDDEFLIDATRGLGGEILEPIKTVNVQGARCMTTWVLSKS